MVHIVMCWFVDVVTYSDANVYEVTIFDVTLHKGMKPVRDPNRSSMVVIGTGVVRDLPTRAKSADTTAQLALCLSVLKRHNMFV